MYATNAQYPEGSPNLNNWKNDMISTARKGLAKNIMAKPEIKQAETRNQANMVSAPYEQANRMAAEKTNPMNAMSQNPGKVFLMKFIGK